MKPSIFFRYGIIVVIGLFLGGCALFSEPPQTSPPAEAGGQETEQQRQADMAGLSGRYKPEAEQAFAEARVLWKRQLSSLADAEVCSDPEKAVTLLDKAIGLEPEYSDAYARRGLAQSERGKREEAFDDLTAAIRFEPKPEYYAYRALASIRGGDGRAAARDLAYSLKKQPEQSRAHNFKGVLELGEDNKTAACSSFTKGCSNGDCSFIEAAREAKICP